MTDYTSYQAEGAEKVKILLQGFVLVTVIAVLFYKSVIAVLLFSPGAWLYLKYQQKKLAKERKWQFVQQFRQGILGLSAALHAGYSVENAFEEALKDLKLMYEKDTDIVQEFGYITRQLSMNQTVENLLEELAERTGIEEVQNFAEVFHTAKRTGGDLMKIIHQTGKQIGDKIEVKREMQVAIAQKQYEANIMAMVPLGIILYLWVASPGFLDCLYHNLFGCLFMTVLLACYGGAYMLMKKITDIEM